MSVRYVSLLLIYSARLWMVFTRRFKPNRVEKHKLCVSALVATKDESDEIRGQGDGSNVVDAKRSICLTRVAQDGSAL